MQAYLPSNQSVLEVASGSGQHALYFTQQNPQLRWQCTELSDARDALQINLNELSVSKFPPVKTLDVLNDYFVSEIKALASFDCLYTSNSLHIMSWDGCLAFMSLASQVLPGGGVCAIYGPFLYDDQPVQSNIDFSAWLKERNPESGVRDIKEVEKGFREEGFEFLADHVMPANNRLLIFKKSSN